ncbi:hypothetical protein [uncultured Pseudokineococcus sp.]|uniref:hypothetical protein n=1 Tax=uncultured Pseudokineococcus sp. TaxID=1642928 RepID=UPI0026291A5E|nr:hypothetical protein [uncultured Pseudokineococcus sp.]
MSDEPAGGQPVDDGPGSGSLAGPPERVVVVAPVADAGRLAGVLALAGVRADVAPLGGRGCLVAARAAAGEAGADADASDAVVRGTSRALGAAPVVVLRTDVRGGAGGSVRAEEWVRGQRRHGADVERSPGLVLAGLPDDAERVVHGTRRVDELDGATTSDGLGRMAAARLATGRGAGGGPRPGGPVGAPSAPSPVLPAALAVAAALVLGLEVARLLAGGGSALVAAVALLGAVLAAGVALRRGAARGSAARSASTGSDDAAGEDGPRAEGS